MLFNILTFQFPGSSLKEKISLQYRQLAFLISTGISAIEGLEILIEQCKNKRTLGVLKSLQEAVANENFSTLTPIAYPKYYNRAFVYILKQENYNEKIASFLHDIADELDDSSELTKRALSAMTYPFILLIIATIITTSLLIFVIPIFEEIFFSFGSTLPIPTLMVLSISKTLINNLYLFIIGIVKDK